jgi:hypothetical protein
MESKPERFWSGIVALMQDDAPDREIRDVAVRLHRTDRMLQINVPKYLVPAMKFFPLPHH